MPNHVSIPIARVKLCDGSRQINIFPHSFLIFLSGQASFSFPLMRMAPSALFSTLAVAPNRERQQKYCVFFCDKRPAATHGSPSHLSRTTGWNADVCVRGARWVRRRRGVKSWREREREGAIRPHCWLMLGWLHEEPWVAILAHYITAHMSYCWGCFHHQPSSVKIMSHQACCE